jgi:O-acetyl-ADP-ribose deacetylase (regulator of RNase III)
MIQVLLDDLAFVEADAVLRPADGSLEPVTPAMRRLDTAAGARFAAQRRIASPLDAGAAVVTGGGDLAAPLVVHVVVQDEHGNAGADRLRRALVSAWQRAAEWNLAVLAAPLVGAGAGQLATEEAAAIGVESFASRPPGASPRELRIVVEREDELAAVRAVLARRG